MDYLIALGNGMNPNRPLNGCEINEINPKCTELFGHWGGGPSVKLDPDVLER